MLRCSGIYRSVQFCRGVVYVNITITINTVLVLLTYCGTAVQVVVRDREYANVPAGVRVNRLTNTISETLLPSTVAATMLCCAVLCCTPVRGKALGLQIYAQSIIIIVGEKFFSYKRSFFLSCLAAFVEDTVLRFT